MRTRLFIFTIFFALFFSNAFAQTHSSVSLDNQIYYIIEQAEIRGLCSPLPGTRPYTQNTIIGVIDEILNSEFNGLINDNERAILTQYLEQYTNTKTGIDWQRGSYRGETVIGGNNTLLSANLGISADIEGSAGIYSNGEQYYGTEIWLQAYMNGDLGANVSYNFIFEGGLMRAPRKYLGEYWTYYEDYDPKESAANPENEYVNREITVYSEPLTHFPYTYKKRWDSSIFYFSNLSGFESWPQEAAGGYALLSELTASFLDNKLIARLGRISREWGSTSFGSSLAFNQMARPFLGIEAEFSPVSWFGISSLTGFLEYHNVKSIYNDPKTFQNLFSVTMMQFRFRNYLFFDFIDAVVYPKRFELGYISPITNSFFYQNNSGKFDNMAITLNLKAQYPGFGSVWVSFFIDEMTFLSDLFTLDRQMYAWQTGINVPLPILQFSSVKLSYTKINPYVYTHHRNFTPWYGDNLMEKSYTNNGVGLGYYLPPNSDEILFRFQTMPAKNITAVFQFQLIRHGADFGDSQVDGSNLLSELDPFDRDINPVLKRFFLHDGAYQWNYIIRAGVEWKMPNIPVTLFSEAGVNFSYFTDTVGYNANSGQAHPYSIIDTDDYPKSTGFIIKLGVRIYPR